MSHPTNGMTAQRGGLAIDGRSIDESKNLSLPAAASSLITPVLLTTTKARVHGFTLYLIHLGDEDVQITWAFRSRAGGKAIWMQHVFGMSDEMLRVVFQTGVSTSAQAYAYLEVVFLHAMAEAAAQQELDVVALVRDVYGLRLGQMAAEANLDVADFLAQFRAAPAEAEEAG